MRGGETVGSGWVVSERAENIGVNGKCRFGG